MQRAVLHGRAGVTTGQRDRQLFGWRLVGQLQRSDGVHQPLGLLHIGCLGEARQVAVFPVEQEGKGAGGDAHPAHQADDLIGLPVGGGQPDRLAMIVVQQGADADDHIVDPRFVIGRRPMVGRVLALGRWQDALVPVLVAEIGFAIQGVRGGIAAVAIDADGGEAVAAGIEQDPAAVHISQLPQRGTYTALQLGQVVTPGQVLLAGKKFAQAGEGAGVLLHQVVVGVDALQIGMKGIGDLLLALL